MYKLRVERDWVLQEVKAETYDTPMEASKEARKLQSELKGGLIAVPFRSGRSGRR